MTHDELEKLRTLLSKFYDAYLALPADLIGNDAAWKAYGAINDVYDYVVAKVRDSDDS